MDILIRILIFIVGFVLIYKYLLPLLPHPFGIIALVILVVAAIIFLLKLV